MNVSPAALSRQSLLRDWIHAVPAMPTRCPPPQALSPACPEEVQPAEASEPPVTAPTLRHPPASDIGAQDWDLLFLAVLERLQAMAVERSAQAQGCTRIQPAGAVLGDCIAALHHLRHSASPARRHPATPEVRIDGAPCIAATGCPCCR